MREITTNTSRQLTKAQDKLAEERIKRKNLEASLEEIRDIAERDNMPKDEIVARIKYCLEVYYDRLAR